MTDKFRHKNKPTQKNYIYNSTITKENGRLCYYTLYKLFSITVAEYVIMI